MLEGSVRSGRSAYNNRGNGRGGGSKAVPGFRNWERLKVRRMSVKEKKRLVYWKKEGKCCRLKVG